MRRAATRIVLVLSSVAALSPAPPGRLEQVALPASLELAWAPLSSAARAPPQTLPILRPRPFRGRLGAAVLENARCAGCHRDEAAEWQRSLHRAAATDQAFVRALAIEPSPFCRGCHAPEADPARGGGVATGLGVGCVTCHVPGERDVVAAPSEAHREAPHAVLRAPDFAADGACSGCHEFRFPAGHGDRDEAFMQTTAREHARSDGQSIGCVGCHMPSRSGHRSHAFGEVRDPDWLRARLHVTATRGDDGVVRVTLEQPSPGHAFPTGDLFRRIEVGAEARGEGGLVVDRRTRYLERKFVIDGHGTGARRLLSDDRVESAPVTVDLPLARAPRTHWWVSYQRVATVGTGFEPADATIESEVRIGSGELP